MVTEKINLGIELIKNEAKENNIYLYGAEVNMNIFLNKLDISFSDFIKGMNNHPFSIIRCGVMLRKELNK